MSTAKQVFSRVYRPQFFTQKIVLSDGSTYEKMTTSPRPSVRLTKDIRNAQLYNPDAGKQVNQEENGRLARFRGRFAGFSEETTTTTDKKTGPVSGQGSASEVDDMDWMVSAGARAAPKMSDREMKESTRKKSAKGKK
ncbi:putative 50S ribosomal protein L36 [Taphrina deformans PYCC 5710]|uniref:50S ribosomal protein L36 n=1 Tax=Taphrina deformans (strain PYCC 5710 / ATCC 11124 / CBS 356.35 / IMI 108563 / JCM 9778 / NBRC 8474) TaxID=1097556 RepID=R4XA52_TAPDE|nr:putative 50S ribosomal protein L36 [Taphrina deformans PYCC 5710]|eukprot:CCG82673.1 putative 50S ribosomal protein L36 [Taphrina deformans PYCC 5710]